MAQRHHDHSHHHSHYTGNITFAFWINTFFALLEVVGGLYTNSVAILSDALHDFGDSLSLGLSWYFQKRAAKKRDEHFSYGYKRFSLLGAFINSVVLIVGSVFVIREAILRLTRPEQPDAKGMIVLAVIGVVVNGLAMLRLKKGDSINERVVSLHFLEDVLGWVAVLIGSIVMMFTHLPVLDPILSILISGFILYNVFRNLKSTFRIVLQAIPENVDTHEIEQKVLTVKGVTGVHDIHAWSMDGNYNIITIHLTVASGTPLNNLEEIKNEVRHCLKHLNIQHITIETEFEGEPCELKNC